MVGLEAEKHCVRTLKSVLLIKFLKLSNSNTDECQAKIKIRAFDVVICFIKAGISEMALFPCIVCTGL